MIARIFLIGAFQGTRVTSILETTYHEDRKAHIDWTRGAINRRAMHAKETSKRRPTVLMVPKIRRFVQNWARNDAARGIKYMIHSIDGGPLKPSATRPQMASLDADAGVGKHVTMHVLRHTLVMWLKNEGVSIWSAANFLGCSTKVLEERYGTWDLFSQVEVVNALTKAAKQKTAAVQLMKDGLIAA